MGKVEPHDQDCEQRSATLTELRSLKARRLVILVMGFNAVKLLKCRQTDNPFEKSSNLLATAWNESGIIGKQATPDKSSANRD
ncbi:hypothetical protein [Halomicronema sp. CCY15110]|uniref:hypothetical protein n=1 Tax=Halomicronema sp. CCY15110 TaxID=2767773 RepID=UPI00195013D7|nr:hypothetical protein [Halomicronema sp. CCY15110]